jgi:hypothetical protein
MHLTHVAKELHPGLDGMWVASQEITGVPREAQDRKRKVDFKRGEFPDSGH